MPDKKKRIYKKKVVGKAIITTILQEIYPGDSDMVSAIDNGSMCHGVVMLGKTTPSNHEQMSLRYYFHVVESC